MIVQQLHLCSLAAAVDTLKSDDLAQGPFVN
jgi:hypothetical protein